jgi:hypothetical protein
LTSILGQLNQIAQIPSDKMLTWLSKLIDSLDPTSSQHHQQQQQQHSHSSIADPQQAAIRYKYTLRQLVIYLSGASSGLQPQQVETSTSTSTSTLTMTTSTTTNTLNESVCLSLQEALIKLATPMIKEASGVFPELIALMDLLSASGQGQGYLHLFQACCKWLENFDDETLVAASAAATGDEITNLVATSNAAIR